MLRLSALGAVGAAGLTLPLGRELSAATISLLPTSTMPKPYAVPFVRQQVLQPYNKTTDGDGHPVHYYAITAKTGTAALATGLATPVLAYNGQVPGPLISVDQGTKVVMTMHNQLPVTHPTFGTPLKISTHLHGSASLPQYDGYANDVTLAGQKKYYHYPNHQPARTLWYHDHGVHYTAQNAYSGLAAQYHLHDDAERALLPQGEFDVPITLSDIAFQANGSQLYDDRSQSGLWGDVILANGRPWPVMKVKPAIYRFRILNASISRSYRPTTSPAVPMYMVGTDGGLAPKSQQISSWRHGNAERYEILIDFRGMAGKTVNLNNLSNPNNRDFDNTNKIMRFDVVTDLPATGDRAFTAIPNLLVPSEAMSLTPTSAMKVRNIRVERVNGLWALNGQTWHDVENSNFTKVLANPNLGDTEIWDIQNNSGGWFHPLHIHLVDFKILNRNGRPAFAYEQGPKDVVYIGENETVRLIMKFGDDRADAPVKNVGKYMVHCHNLVHEDHDMMHQFSVGLNDQTDPNNPVDSDPAVDENTNRED